MPQHPHLRITVAPAIEPYTYPQVVGGGPTFNRPPREPVTHAANLSQQLNQIAHEAQAATPDAEEIPGITLEFEGEPGFELWLDSLEDQRKGIELLNARTQGNVHFATVFVPQGKLGHFLRLVEDYASTLTSQGRASEKVVESISLIRRATLRSFWTDVPTLFPQNDQPIWWEIWLRASRGTRGDLTIQQFRMLATESDISLSTFDVIRFAERAVLLGWAPASAWTHRPDLLDTVAELRQAKELPTGYTTLPPRLQWEFTNELLQRIAPPNVTAPAVCILDTGVQQGHPLLSAGLNAADTLSVNAAWGTADHHGHGTEMAGLALYEDLARLLVANLPVVLVHRLESVKARDIIVLHRAQSWSARLAKETPLPVTWLAI